MTVRIGDSKYFTALIELLQAQGESDLPIELDAAKLGLTIAIPVDELFTKAFRTKIRDWSLDVVESSGETTLAAIAQNATATQLNLSLGDGLNNGETFDLLAFDLYARLATFNAGDRAEIFWALETGIRGAFPVIGARNPGLIKHTRGWVAIDTAQLVDRITVQLPQPYRMVKQSTTVRNPILHAQVTNRRAAVGNIDCTIGGSVLVRPV